MKKQLLFLSAFIISLTIFGQKSELKTAEKALKSNNFAAAMAAINQAEGLIANADQKTKAKFYYLKGKALYQNGAANTDIEKTAKAFNQLLDFEKETKKYKYSKEIGELINKLIDNTANKASESYKLAAKTKAPEDYKVAAKNFHQVYLLSPRDTSYLDNAALVYYLGKDYDTSIKLYQQLLDLGYTGIAKIYKATEKESGKDLIFPDKKSMDLQVKLGLAENPRTEMKESRREYIFKNLAQSYAAKDNPDKALEILAQGRKEFPNSYSLLIDEANIYYKKGDKQRFKDNLELAISLNPTEPTLYFNVGVMNMDLGYEEEAVKNFTKAIELDPEYGNAYNNLGSIILKKSEAVQEELNKNAMDFAKYDKIKEEKLLPIYREALPYFEKAYSFLKTEQLKNLVNSLYENLDMEKRIE